MAKQSSSRVIGGLFKLQYTTHQVKPTFNSSSLGSLSAPFRVPPDSSSSIFSTGFSTFQHSRSSLSGTALLQNLARSVQQNTHLLKLTPTCRSSAIPKSNISYSSGFRFFSISTSEKKVNKNFAKKVFEKPSRAVTSIFLTYREAIGLHFDAFWKRNYLFLLGAGGVVTCALLWRIMFGVANTFVGLSEGMAKYGFLALSSAIVAFSGLYIRARLTINPDKVYRIAMRKLNTSAGILEVMGAPLAGTDLRAYVMSGGGITLKNFRPRLRSKRCFLIFPIHGSEKKGLVSVEVKKKKGQYDMKLLAVDIPMASGPDQRLYLIGDEEEYKVGGGLIGELRDPVVKALAATKEFDDLDEIEEEEDAERELQEAERKHREEIEKIERSGSQ